MARQWERVDEDTAVGPRLGYRLTRIDNGSDIHRQWERVLQCQVIVPQLLSPVVDEPAGDAVDLPPADEELERELMGREEVEPPVAIEVPAPGEPTSEERRHHRLTHLPYQPWCNVCVRGRGREN